MHRLALYTLVLVLGSAAALVNLRPAHGADDNRVRPRVGLVLSGGGARGAAHIGVIRTLEQARIPVDSITGVSMGAVVGALYASGMSAADLEAVLTGINWQDAFNDAPTRRDLSFRRKQDDRDFLADFELGLKGRRLRLPQGLIQGQKLNLILRDLLYPAVGIQDFDALPIPFRAVATDVETGDAVVLKSGDLAKAARASMAVPGVFAPVQLEGRMLVDGGIASNLPVGVARDAGADVLIVVDIAFPLLPRDRLFSALEITNQMITILMRRASERELGLLREGDILIRPNLEDMGSADFTRSAEAVELGAAAAERALPGLAYLSLSETEYQRYQVARKLPPPSDREIDFVDVVDDSRLSAQVIQSHLDTLPGTTFNLGRVEGDIANLYGLGSFQTVDYRLVQRDGQTGLELGLDRKSWGPNYLNFGLQLQDDLEGSSAYTLGIRYTRTDVNSLGAEWRADLQVGGNPRLVSEFFQPLDFGTRYFVAPRFDIERFTATSFEDGQPTAEYRVTQGGVGVDVGRQLGNWGEVRLGLERGKGRARLRTGDPQLPSIAFDSGSFFASMGYDRIDNVGFPRRGNFATLSWQGFRESLGADSDTDRVLAIWSGALSSGRHTTLFSLRAGSNLDGEAALQNLFDLGGLFQLSGLRSGQLRGQHFGIAGLAWYRRLGDVSTSNFGVPVYAGLSLEMGNVWDDSDDIAFSTLRQAGSLFVGVDTFLGPVYLAYGIAENGNRAAYFTLGQTF